MTFYGDMPVIPTNGCAVEVHDRQDDRVGQRTSSRRRE